jgi:formylglycine-generating enzyme required for sulfatase activity
MQASHLCVFAALVVAMSAAGAAQSVQVRDVTIPGMAYIPAGDFWMGRVRMWMVDEIGWQVRERADDRPLHLVGLDAFHIDVLEVTNAQYAEFVKATKRKAPYHWGPSLTPSPERLDIPIYNVDWDDASAYCQWQGKRLPTEAEWEKAARGGLDRQDFPWGMDYETQKPTTTAPEPAAGSAIPADSVAGNLSESGVVRHAWSNSPHGPTKVGRYEPNGFGLFDMSGNVWEWTNDWYDLFEYSVAARRNPQGPQTGLYKVIRGGGWSDDDSRMGSVYIRNFANPDLKSPTIGFRCAKSASVRGQ